MLSLLHAGTHCCCKQSWPAAPLICCSASAAQMLPQLSASAQTHAGLCWSCCSLQLLQQVVFLFLGCSVLDVAGFARQSFSLSLFFKSSSDACFGFGRASFCFRSCWSCCCPSCSRFCCPFCLCFCCACFGSCCSFAQPASFRCFVFGFGLWFCCCLWLCFCLDLLGASAWCADVCMLLWFIFRLTCFLTFLNLRMSHLPLCACSCLVCALFPALSLLLLRCSSGWLPSAAQAKP